MAEVDLERLADAYRHRSEETVVQRIDPILGRVALGSGDLVVDIGGGRGRHASAIGSATGAGAMVVDPSRGMVREARAAGVAAVVGRGEALPLEDDGCALALFHLSIHHGDWRRMLQEAWRVVRPGGAVWVWTMPPESLATGFLAHWFPRIGEIDSVRFPAIADLASQLEELGGDPRRVNDTSVIRRTAGDWVEAVRAGFVSTLHLLEPVEVEDGLARFSVAHPDPTTAIEYALSFCGVWSRKPPVEF